MNLSTKAVSPCLVGIGSYSKPLIDIFGTSAILYQAILPRAAKLSMNTHAKAINDNFNSDQLPFPDCTLEIETVLITIPDVPESAQVENTKVRSDAQIFERGQLKIHRFLLRCNSDEQQS